MTTLGPSLIITGDISSQEAMTIHGHVNGQITMQQGDLVIAPTGSTDANVQGIRITVHGKVAGDISATERIELTDTANVTGTITAPSLVMRDGTTFNGLIDMPRKGKAAGAPNLTLVEPKVAKAS